MAHTDAALASARIRKEIKALKVKAKVRSENYSGGSSINVRVADQSPEVVAAIEAICAKYKRGHFDGMTDSYEYSNCNDDIPQVSYVFVNVDFSDDLYQSAYNFLKNRIHTDQELPEKFDDAHHLYVFGNDDIMANCWRILRGSSTLEGFWDSFELKAIASK